MDRSVAIDRALEGARHLGASRAGQDLTTPIGTLVGRPPLFVSSQASVAEAARLMRDAGVSSALIAGDPPGILTDGDLRGRVLAEGLGADTPVRAVMSSPLKSVPADTPIFGALLWILEEGFHHVPVARGAEIIGVVTERDLVRHQARSPLLLLYRVQHLEESPDALAGYSREVAAVAEGLFEGGLDAVHIGRVIATLNDALATRLLRLAERELGSPPCPYAWMVLGSEGRMEQVLLSDQDNALVFAAQTGDDGEYFRALAQRVVDGLIRAGFPACPGGYMATNWCRSLDDWVATFRGWIELPEPQALLEAEIFFDFRAVHGELSLEPLEAILRSSGRRELFLHHLARTSLSFRPPLGFLGRIQEHEGAVDLKAGGIAASVMLARTYALAAHSGARSTVERLAAAAEAGTLSRGGAERLADTFRFLTRLRLQEQLRSLRAGDSPSNCVRLEALSALERRRLREALRTVRQLQDATALRFRVQD